jgi:GTP-binding protein
MKIHSVEFAGAIARPGDPPPSELPQVAFSGRSNVGKSSLINRVLGRTRAGGVARVSATPGKTQHINFFEVRAGLSTGRAAQFLLADLPGYGYARVPESVRREWKPLIESYLSSSPHLRGVVQLVDIRHEAKPDDLRMLEYLATLALPTLVVLTKSDKLTASKRRERREALQVELGLGEEQVLAVSAETGDGCDELVAGLGDLLEEGG